MSTPRATSIFVLATVLVALLNNATPFMLTRHQINFRPCALSYVFLSTLQRCGRVSTLPFAHKDQNNVHSSISKKNFGEHPGTIYSSASSMYSAESSKKRAINRFLTYMAISGGASLVRTSAASVSCIFLTLSTFSLNQHQPQYNNRPFLTLIHTVEVVHPFRWPLLSAMKS